MGFILKDNAGGDLWKNIIVVLNGSRKAQTVKVPDGRYTVVCRDGVINEKGIGKIRGSRLTVAPQSALIVYE